MQFPIPLLERGEIKEQTSFCIASTDTNKLEEYIQYLHCSGCEFTSLKAEGKEAMVQK